MDDVDGALECVEFVEFDEWVGLDDGIGCEDDEIFVSRDELLMVRGCCEDTEELEEIEEVERDETGRARGLCKFSLLFILLLGSISGLTIE